MPWRERRQLSERRQSQEDLEGLHSHTSSLNSRGISGLLAPQVDFADEEILLEWPTGWQGWAVKGTDLWLPASREQGYSLGLPDTYQCFMYTNWIKKQTALTAFILRRDMNNNNKKAKWIKVCSPQSFWVNHAVDLMLKLLWCMHKASLFGGCRGTLASFFPCLHWCSGFFPLQHKNWSHLL